MPATHTIPVTPPPTLYTVTRNGSDPNLRLAQADADTSNGVALETTTRLAGTKRKRGAYQLELSRARGGEELQEEATITISEEDYDLEQHKRLFAQRNFDKVHFGEWQIKTWYFSPYPLTEPELEDNAASTSSLSPSNSPAFASTSNTRGAAQKSAMNIAGARIPGVPRTTPRSHVRTSDLLAGGLGRQNMPPGERATLWVCDMCFKYMAEGLTWEMHKRECMVKHPPGRKVYQRGAHTIWEVDGAKDKLYCQNLSLFGKLFIDVKTLFFDSDNFLFYILTDATSQADHMMGFFSKEKVSFDSYNLACIITLPPYQRQGYGMLMIEFSYELSRRANQVGTPERPLSDLGLRSYLAYWVASLIRFFRRVLSALPHDAPKQAITTRGNFPDIVNGCRSPSSLSSSGQEDLETSSLNASAKKRRKSVKGWDDPQFTSLRTFTTTPQADGSAVTHVSVRCTLSDIAHATNLRIEDAAFALNECGLLVKKIKAKERNIDVVEGTGIAGVSANDTVVLTREMVEQVAKERNVKKPCMDRAYVLL
ncbi:hypothetical protein M378DRAFT_187391 [Amanita muscaria Koide BX008]|uniref:histone acetyltransferase n=1 Tax=Amanita muscaria (strain Koide BX008) TaxID=946122 RepID=A0A0C2T6H4_AMAMK|nr:hypothetical protein M378DRAFT_187391 [Amanita muscaria Koide BX008]